MQTLQEYKCPCCGGAIAFDSGIQKMKCPYCDTEFDMETLASYDDGNGGNTITDALDAAGYGQWVKVDLGTSIALMRKVDPLEQGTVANYQTQYDLLSELKGDDFTNELYAEGAAMEHDLSDSAMNTYKASNIKRKV